MLITITGYIVIILVLFLVINNGLKKSIIDPRLYILYMYWVYWGKTDSLTIQTIPDILLAISFLIYCFFLHISMRMNFRGTISFYNKIFRRLSLKKEISPLSYKKQLLLFILVVLYVISDITLNTMMYGSFDFAMTRFYVRRILDNSMSYYSTLLSVFFMLSLIGLFIIRFSNVYFKQSKLLFYVGIILMIAISIPRGTRGALVATVAIPYMADIFIMVLYKKKLTSIIKSSTIILLCGVIYLSYFLTVIRGQSFDKISDVQEVLVNFDMSSGIETFNDKEKDLMMKDYYFVYNNYGDRLSFLPIYYTGYSVLTNLIPRNLWEKKPVGFGRILAYSKLGNNSSVYSYKYLNDKLSMSFAVGICGEGWANDGILGVIMYSILLGLLSGYFISIYWYMINKRTYLSIIIALLFYKCSSAYIRGDITSGITQSVYPLLLMSVILLVYSHIKNVKLK